VLHRRLLAISEKRRFPLISIAVSAPGAVLCDHVLDLSDVLGDGAAGCKSKRALFRSITYWWNTMLFVMKQTSGGKSRLDNKSKVFDPLTLPSCKTVTYVALDTDTRMTQFRNLDNVPGKIETDCSLRKYVL